MDMTGSLYFEMVDMIIVLLCSKEDDILALP